MAENTGDRITFKCVDCGHTVSIDNDNPPNDDDVLKCMGCGREFGTFGVVKAAMIEAGKAEVDKMVEKALGRKPTWRKG